MRKHTWHDFPELLPSGNDFPELIDGNDFLELCVEAQDSDTVSADLHEPDCWRSLCDALTEGLTEVAENINGPVAQ